MTRFRTETGSAPSGSEGIREDRERLRADNAALKQQLDVMRALAFRDQLTGLFSRHYLTDYLEQEIERMSGEANIVLALCDIDDFKLINDVRGLGEAVHALLYLGRRSRARRRCRTRLRHCGRGDPPPRLAGERSVACG